MIEDLTKDPDCEPYHPSHTRASSCADAEVHGGGNASPKYPMGNQAGEHHKDVCDRPKVSEGDGGSMSETLCTELVNHESLEVESVTNTGEKVESTPRYNLRPVREEMFRFIIELLFLFLLFTCSMYFVDCVYIC
jgi:hypothetical protein